MAKRPRKTRKPQAKLQELVVVTFAKDSEQAKDYETLLKTDDIPVVVKEQKESQASEITGFAVMVPEDFLDEAYVIIESQNAYDDFYDFALENEDSTDLDSDFFEDDF